MLYLGYLIIAPVIIPILLSFMIAYLAFPLYRWINKYIKSEGLSSFIVAILILMMISLPIIFLMNSLISQTQVAFTLSRRAIITGDLFYGQCTGENTTLCNIINPVQDLVKDPKVKFYLEDALQRMTDTIIDKATGFVFAIPKRILDLFIMLFTIYYLFKDGPRFVNRIKTMLPVCRGTCNLMIGRIRNVFEAMIYGYFMVALIQGVLGGIGLFAVGISSPVLWGGVMALVSLLPMFGAALVWAPASLFLILSGLIENDMLGIWKGIALFAYGLAIVSTIDNILRPKLVSKRADIHPVVVLIGVVGGLSFLGFIGIILGPIILIVIITLFSMYEKINMPMNKIKVVKKK